MAKMGTRNLAPIRKGNPPDFTLAIPMMAVNLLTVPVQIQPTATLGFTPPALGYPIMREGFITHTGFRRGFSF